MKIVFKAKALDIKNEETENPKKYFHVLWNYFEIEIIKESPACYASLVTSPLGEMLVGYVSYKTMKEAVQDAFNNIELDITEKEAMLTERNQLLQDGEVTKEDLSEIEYWYWEVIEEYYNK